MSLLSKLHRNSILTGPVDSFCLICGCLLRSEEESYAHIQEPSHVDKLNAVPQLADYNECVIKCKAGYFCIYCNVILPTIKRVSLHVAEATHNKNRIAQSITRPANLILAFNTVVIQERAWNGLDGSTCSVCNKDYDDEEAHRRDSSHVLKLIQSPCEFGDTYIYRKVDDELFFCLICDEIFHIFDKTTHHESDKHLELYEKSKKDKYVTQSKSIQTNNSIKPSNEVKSADLKPQDNKTKHVNNNVQTGSAQAVPDIQKPSLYEENPKKVKNVVQNSDPNLQTAGKITQDSLNAFSKTNVKISASLNENDKLSNEINDETVLPKKDSYLYEMLKSNNFIIKLQNGVACCTLCDAQLREGMIGLHTLDPHHKILYAKHITHKNENLNVQNKESISANNESVPKSITKEPKIVTTDDKTESANIQSKEIITAKNETIDKTVTKEPSKVTADNKTDLTHVKNDKIVEVKKKDAPISKKEAEVNPKRNPDALEKQDTPKEIKPLDTKTQGKSTENQNCIDKENTPPAKNNETLPISTSQSKENTTDAESNASKKVSKKAQKKAAKAKAQAEAISKTDTPPVVENIGPKSDHNNGRIEDLAKELEQTKDGDENTDFSEKVNQMKTISTEIKTSSTEIKTERLLSLIKTVSHVDTQDDVVVNRKCVIGSLSFVLVMNSDAIQCVACAVKLEAGGVTKHINTDEHKKNVEECLVVTSLAEEFVRQVKTQEYHCGFCNIVLSDWQALLLHLDTDNHSEAKLSAEWRLHRYQPYLKSSEVKEVRSVITTIFRCTKE